MNMQRSLLTCDQQTWQRHQFQSVLHDIVFVHEIVKETNSKVSRADWYFQTLTDSGEVFDKVLPVAYLRWVELYGSQLRFFLSQRFVDFDCDVAFPPGGSLAEGSTVGGVRRHSSIREPRR